MTREIFIIGLSHHNSDVSIREAFALSDPELRAKCLPPISLSNKASKTICPKMRRSPVLATKVQAFSQNFIDLSKNCPVDESLVLSTCNRVELAVVGKTSEAAEYMIKRWAEARGKTAAELKPYVYIHKGEEAIRHLFTVASSLDSLVLGEPQILGQLKEAYRNAVENQQTKVILNRLLHKAFYVAKRVRSETAIASSAVSISYAAVELAKRIFGCMSDSTAMLIGAGEMAELAATHLINAGVPKILVANRTLGRAQELVAQFKNVEARAVPFEELTKQLHEADIVISSTGSPDTILNAKDIKEVLKKRKQRPMFLIDIAVPRDIDADVNDVDNVYLYDIDDLKDVVEENLAQRREEAERAKKIVEEETSIFCSWLRSLELQPTIVDLLNKAEQVAEEELSRTLKKLGNVDTNTQDALKIMLQSVIKKLNHEPIAYLKKQFEEEHSPQHIDVFRQMFKLDSEDLATELKTGLKAGLTKELINEKKYPAI